MTQDEKNIIIEEAQKVVDNYNDTPKDPTYYGVRVKYSEQFVTIQTLYMRLTGNMLAISGDGRKVEEKEV